MREIKFRAWDKRLSKMLYSGFALIPTTPDWSATVLRNDEQANVILQKLDKERGDIIGGDYSTVDWADWYATEHYELMQFTGLYDKNGKEIWEGDILFSQRITDTMSEMEIQEDGKWTVDVVFEDGSFCYGKGGDPLDIGECKKEMEIIGNVYRNPELLMIKE